MKLDFDTDDGIGTRANLGVIVLETDETQCFWVNRIDGTSEKFSFRTCYAAI